MKRGTKDVLWTGALAVAITGLITWRAREKARDEKREVEPHERGVYR